MERLNAIAKKRTKVQTGDKIVIVDVDTRHHEDIQEQLQLFSQRMQHGVEEIDKALAFVPDYQDLKASFEETITICMNAIAEEKEIENLVLDCVTNGKQSLQQIYGITNEMMSYMYQAAKRLLDKKYYIEAAASFSFLSLFSPQVYDFWNSLGVSSLKLQRIDDALFATAQATQANPLMPWPYLYKAECYKKLNDKSLALEALDMAEKLAKESQDFQLVMKEIAKLQEDIRQLEIKQLEI